MYTVSNEWAAKYSDYLAPEGFVELTFDIPEILETMVYTKSDLMRFSHQQTGDPTSGSLPKNHIEFALDNSDGMWNPHNPTGLGRYLTERLKITLRYGADIDGVVEWIPGGVFYLTEWRASPNGMEASFVARDMLEYMIDAPYTGSVSGTLYEIAERAVAAAGLPNGTVVNLCEELKDYSVDSLLEYDGDSSIAEILQKCANAAGCVMYQDREGVLWIKKPDYTDTGYVVSMFLAYTYPEFDYLRHAKTVQVTYFGDTTVLYQVGGNGEVQTLQNDFISSGSQATEIAEWVYDSLRTRKQISGEFRGDPVLDVFDTVTVESKYGTITDVVITDIKYDFTGAFHATYSGYVRSGGTPVFVHCGEVYLGEVV